MKKVIIILSAFASINCISQNSLPTYEQPDKKVIFGFQLGVLKSYIEPNKQNSAIDVKVKNKLSFMMGPEINIKLNETFGLHIPLVLAFHESEVSVSENQNITNFKPYFLNLGVSSDLKVNFLKKGKNKPYLLVGPNLRTFWWKEEPSTSLRDIDFAINLAIGLDKQTEFFIFAPELKYTYGFMKTYRNPSSDIAINPQLHTLSLILHFRD